MSLPDPPSTNQTAPNFIDPRTTPPPGTTAVVPRIEASTGSGTYGIFRDGKERYASRLAVILTWTFASTVGLSLLGIFGLLWLDRHDPENAKALLTAGVDALKEACVSLTGLFGPLLAFVLGYYFKETNKSE